MSSARQKWLRRRRENDVLLSLGLEDGNQSSPDAASKPVADHDANVETLLDDRTLEFEALGVYSAGKIVERVETTREFAREDELQMSINLLELDAMRETIKDMGAGSVFRLYMAKSKASPLFQKYIQDHQRVVRHATGIPQNEHLLVMYKRYFTKDTALTVALPDSLWDAVKRIPEMRTDAPDHLLQEVARFCEEYIYNRYWGDFVRSPFWKIAQEKRNSKSPEAIDEVATSGGAVSDRWRVGDTTSTHGFEHGRSSSPSLERNTDQRLCTEPPPPEAPTLSFQGPPETAEQIAEYREYQVKKYEFERWLNDKLRKAEREADAKRMVDEVKPVIQKKETTACGKLEAHDKIRVVAEDAARRNAQVESKERAEAEGIEGRQTEQEETKRQQAAMAWPRRRVENEQAMNKAATADTMEKRGEDETQRVAVLADTETNVEEALVKRKATKPAEQSEESRRGVESETARVKALDGARVMEEKKQRQKEFASPIQRDAALGDARGAKGGCTAPVSTLRRGGERDFRGNTRGHTHPSCSIRLPGRSDVFGDSFGSSVEESAEDILEELSAMAPEPSVRGETPLLITTDSSHSMQNLSDLSPAGLHHSANYPEKTKSAKLQLHSPRGYFSCSDTTKIRSGAAKSFVEAYYAERGETEGACARRDCALDDTHAERPTDTISEERPRCSLGMACDASAPKHWVIFAHTEARSDGTTVGRSYSALPILPPLPNKADKPKLKPKNHQRDRTGINEGNSRDGALNEKTRVEEEDDGADLLEDLMGELNDAEDLLFANTLCQNLSSQSEQRQSTKADSDGASTIFTSMGKLDKPKPKLCAKDIFSLLPPPPDKPPPTKDPSSSPICSRGLASPKAAGRRRIHARVAVALGVSAEFAQLLEDQKELSLFRLFLAKRGVSPLFLQFILDWEASQLPDAAIERNDMLTKMQTVYFLGPASALATALPPPLLKKARIAENQAAVYSQTSPFREALPTATAGAGVWTKHDGVAAPHSPAKGAQCGVPLPVRGGRGRGRGRGRGSRRGRAGERERGASRGQLAGGGVPPGGGPVEPSPTLVVDQLFATAAAAHHVMPSAFPVDVTVLQDDLDMMLLDFLPDLNSSSSPPQSPRGSVGSESSSLSMASPKRVLYASKARPIMGMDRTSRPEQEGALSRGSIKHITPVGVQEVRPICLHGEDCIQLTDLEHVMSFDHTARPPPGPRVQLVKSKKKTRTRTTFL